MIIEWVNVTMIDKFISPEQINFTNECLNMYKEFCNIENRNVLFNNCVKERLNNLLIENSKKLDNTINNLERFTDDTIFVETPFNRCENYCRMVKEKNKYNINYMKKLFTTYNKSCRMSNTLLKRLIKSLAE